VRRLPELRPCACWRCGLCVGVAALRVLVLRPVRVGVAALRVLVLRPVRVGVAALRVLVLRPVRLKNILNHFRAVARWMTIAHLWSGSSFY